MFQEEISQFHESLNHETKFFSLSCLSGSRNGDLNLCLLLRIRFADSIASLQSVADNLGFKTLELSTDSLRHQMIWNGVTNGGPFVEYSSLIIATDLPGGVREHILLQLQSARRQGYIPVESVWGFNVDIANYLKMLLGLQGTPLCLTIFLPSARSTSLCECLIGSAHTFCSV